MEEFFLGALRYLYGSVALVALTGYLPQIFKLWRSRGESDDVSLLTWCIWLSASTISLFYGAVCLRDLPSCLVAAANIAGQAAIIGLTLHNRRRRIKSYANVVKESD